MTNPSKNPVIKIQPSHGWAPIHFRDLWDYRELVYFLVWRDVKVRYKQTFLGAAWAVVQPFTAMIVFTLFFGKLARLPSDGIPYPIFSYAALVPWVFFANAMTQSANSLAGSSNLIQKVYFLRLVIPLAAALSGVIDFLIASSLLAVMMIFYGIEITPAAAWLPFFAFIALITALGAGFWLSALTVEFRDFRFTLPFLTQIWMFATPVVYSSSLLAEPWRSLYGLNPMAGVIEGFRACLLGSESVSYPMIFVSALVSGVLLISGAYYFKRMEKTFSDVI
jgi:lipopolysaccharide transport system permease protein